MRKLFKGALITLFIAAVIAVGYVGVGGYLLYRGAMDEMPLAERVEGIRSNPNYTPLSELPKTYLNAVVAVEDHRFYQHFGIDPLAIGRAIAVDIYTHSLREGGSTITQQLAKNLCYTQRREFTRKVAEVFTAFELEQSYTKDEILELYVNSIYFGRNCYCVRDASLAFFGKEPCEMTGSECALLAGIPNAPSVYGSEENGELSLQRQRQVVAAMLEHGMLTDEEAREILTSESDGIADLCS